MRAVESSESSDVRLSDAPRANGKLYGSDSYTVFPSCREHFGSAKERLFGFEISVSLGPRH
jgi:hypothetical protein